VVGAGVTAATARRALTISCTFTPTP
jgi:hypothetical protein